MPKSIACFLLFVCLGASAHSIESVAEDTIPLRRAHAHNDYLHDRPLLDALDQGFCSVEADIYLVDGELLVAHDPWQQTPERNLEALYLKPLRKRCQRNNGRVHRQIESFTLLIDIKSDAKETFLALNQLLAKYDDVFTRVENGKVISKGVIAIVSGNRDNSTILAQNPRFAGIDGRLTDLNSKLQPHELPLISDHWGRNFKWRGVGPISKADAAKLSKIIDQVHNSDRRIRFWATPDTPSVWKALNDAGVDLINTDKLKELSEFLSTENAPPIPSAK